MSKTVKARVLVDCGIDGVNYKCNQVMEADKDLVEAHKEYLDDNKKSVDFCINELGAKVITHEKPEPAAKAEDEKPAE